MCRSGRTPSLPPPKSSPRRRCELNESAAATPLPFRSAGGPKPQTARAPARGFDFLGSGLPDVLRLQPLRPLHDLELDLLPFRERAEAIHLDGGVMTEDVVSASILGDEAEPLRVVEPLHGTSRHSERSFSFGAAGLQAGTNVRVRWRGRLVPIRWIPGQDVTRRRRASRLLAG